MIRKPRATLALVVSIAFVGCSAHNGATIPLGYGSNASQENFAAFSAHAPMAITAAARALDAQHWKSRSPGKIQAAPMRLVRGPALSSARAVRLHPRFLQNTLQFAQLPGTVTQAVVSPTDGSIFVLSNQPAGTDKYIYHYSNGTYTNIPGQAARLAISPYGDKLWAVNASGGIYAYTIATGQWSTLAGGAADITIGSDDAVYVLSNSGGDGRGDYPIWHYSGGIWTELNGSGMRIDAAWDPNTYQLTGGSFNPGGFYTFSASGQLFYFSPGVGFIQIPGKVQSIASVTSGFFAIGSGSIYYYELASQTYTAEPGTAASLGANGSLLCAVTASDALYAATIVLRNPRITEYGVPTTSSQPFGIATGSDGAVWFAEFGGNNIGRLTASGAFHEYAVPTLSSEPDGIASGPDGALWFTEYQGGKIGRITTGGTITEYAIPTTNSGPTGIAAGPDGALWFLEFGVNGNRVGRITTGGTVTGEYSIPTANSGPETIVAGPDGALWFTEVFGSKIGRITTDGTITEYATPTASSGVAGITPAPGGGLWFTEDFANNVGRITTAGAITEYAIPTSSSLPWSLTSGADGAIYFTEKAGNKIGRVGL
jgi:streptogramin lyase